MSGKVYTLMQIVIAAKAIAAKHGLKRMVLFGSYARGSATPESDLDFYIERGNPDLRLTALIADLDEVFMIPIDVVTLEGLQDSIHPAQAEKLKSEIFKDGVIVYGEEQ